MTRILYVSGGVRHGSSAGTRPVRIGLAASERQERAALQRH